MKPAWTRGADASANQVLQEFADVARKKFATCLSPSDCQAFIDAAMQPLMRVASSTELVHTAMNLQNELNYSFYDCLMLAAALEAGADTLYTENCSIGNWCTVRRASSTHF